MTNYTFKVVGIDLEKNEISVIREDGKEMVVPFSKFWFHVLKEDIERFIYKEEVDDQTSI